MKFIFLITFFSFSSIAFGASKTIAQCTVNQVVDYTGARINLLQMKDGQLKANLIFGTTVSGTAYRVQEVSPGVFEGSIRNQPQFSIRLVISSKGKTNRYVNGFSSALEAIYPDVNSSTGKGSVKTTTKDNFVCGKIISRF